METIKDIMELFSTFAAAITPITVALIGYWQVKKDKADKEYRELREQNEQLQLAEAKREREENDAKFKALQDDVTNISDQLSELRQEFDIQRIERHLNNLNTLNEFNFEYIQNISGLVCSVGDVLASSDTLDGELREQLKREIHSHKNKENDIVKKLYKVIV